MEGRKKMGGAAAVCMLLAAALPMSTGQELELANWILTTNVTQHSRIDLDVREMDSLVDAGDVNDAFDVYQTGGNSLKTDSTRTIEGFGTKALKGVLYQDYAAYWNEEFYTDAFTSAACGGTDGGVFGDFSDMGQDSALRQECCTKGAQFHNIFQYVIHEMEDAIEDCAAGDANDNDDDQVVAWEEAWAFWTGSLEGENGSGDTSVGFLGYNTALKRCESAGTCAGSEGRSGQALVNARMLALFQEGRGYLEDGDCGAAEPVKSLILRQMMIPLLQGMIRYHYQATSPDVADLDKVWGELWAYSAAVIPFINRYDATLATHIRTNADINEVAPMSALSYADTFKALLAALPSMGIECEELGGLIVDGEYVEGLEPCGQILRSMANFIPTTDVSQHARIDLDVRDMDTLVDAGDLADAFFVYQTGGNSLKSDSIRTIEGFGTKELKGDTYTDYGAYWGEEFYADAFTAAACGGTDGGVFGDFSDMGDDNLMRQECCTKGAQFHNIFQYVIHEMEDAIEDCEAGDLNDNDADVKAWEEAVAFWTGSLEGENGSGDSSVGFLGYNTALKRCSGAGTCLGSEGTSGDALVNVRMLALFNEGRERLLAGECDTAKPIKDDIIRQMMIPLMQGMIRYSVQTTQAQEAGESLDKVWGEHWAYSAAVIPFIAKYDSALARDLRTNADVNEEAPMSALTYQDAFKALLTALPGMGIDCEALGGLIQDGAYVTGVEPCGQTLRSMASFIPTTDVSQHARIDLDVRDMDTLVDAGDLADAFFVYQNGGNSLKSDSIRTIEGFGTKELKGDTYQQYKAYWGEDFYADAFTAAACGGTDGGEFGDFSGMAEDNVMRQECCTKGAQFHNIFQYVIHEMEDAIEDCEAGDLNDNDAEVKAWEEAVAFWTGSLEGENGSGDSSVGFLGYNTALKRCSGAGTCLGSEGTAGDALVNVRMLALFNEGRKDLLAGECSEAAEIKDDIIRQMMIPLMQGMIRYSVQTTQAQEAGESLDKVWGEHWAYSAAVIPFIAQYDEDLARDLRTNADINEEAPMSAMPFDEAFTRLVNALPDMSIDCEALGGLIQNNVYVPGTEACLGGTSGGTVRTSSVGSGGSKKSIPDWAIALLVLALVAVVALAALAAKFYSKGKKDVQTFHDFKERYAQNGAKDLQGTTV